MPSSLDPSRAERLADIYARADRLRRQRRTRLGAGALLGSLAVFLVGLLVGNSLEVPHQLRTIGQPDVPSTTATTEGHSTTTLPDRLADSDHGDRGSNTPPHDEGPVAVPPFEPPPVQPPATSAPPTTEAPTADVTVPPACRNSVDPACGPLRYEPPPVNHPMVVDVTFVPQRPKPGENVTFTVRVRDDGPASPGNCVNQQMYGEVDEVVGVCTASCVEDQRFGPWDPPPPETTRFQETFSHTYAEAGTYTATFAYNVGGDCTFSPYRSGGEASITVEVG
ncbi:MAG TPA: hypothetical protein VGV93_10965 [Acidimicrobiales bacterium]|nr:hypothetical protein [Acidimicrobiales bacterium]